MANIDKPYGILADTATDGKKSRQAIVDCFNLINTDGADATTLQGEYTAASFVSKDDLNYKMGKYLRRTGRVHSFKKMTDPDGNRIYLTAYYESGKANTPFDKKGKTDPDIEEEITYEHPTQSTEAAANASEFDVTFATSYAIWELLKYKDAQDLSQYISDHDDGQDLSAFILELNGG